METAHLSFHLMSTFRQHSGQLQQAACHYNPKDFTMESSAAFLTHAKAGLSPYERATLRPFERKVRQPASQLVNQIVFDYTSMPANMVGLSVQVITDEYRRSTSSSVQFQSSKSAQCSRTSYILQSFCTTLGDGYVFGSSICLTTRHIFSIEQTKTNSAVSHHNSYICLVSRRHSQCLS